ncbi:hypothetical protein A3Q56_05058 [Intoshia linei]|uniref:Uncharacterized protein n=1 Tax=Intoshia linei TaxID=1819745 RepID=A0A177B0F7_9BILA|nr:hypothetical protein A3Q56_05058 [Intoshia linei]
MNMSKLPLDYNELKLLMIQNRNWKQKFPILNDKIKYIKTVKSLKPRSKEKRGLNNMEKFQPKTEYDCKYTPKYKVRPRSTKKLNMEGNQTLESLRPQKVSLDENYKTRSKLDFGPILDKVEKRLPFAIKETYEKSNEPFIGQTLYNQDFYPKAIKPIITSKHTTKIDEEVHIPKFIGCSTTKSSFKKWNKNKKNIGFCELPSFGKSLINSEIQLKIPETTTQSNFKKKEYSKVDAIRPIENNTLTEGNIDFQTTTSNSYKLIENSNYQYQNIVKKNANQESYHSATRVPFNGQSQTAADYVSLEKHLENPLYSKLSPPHTSINIKNTCSNNFETENRKQYKKLEPKNYKVNIVKKYPDKYVSAPYNTGKTVTETEFITHDLKKLIENKKLIKSEINTIPESLPAMTYETCNNSFYRNWKPKPRQKHGDFHETMKKLTINLSQNEKCNENFTSITQQEFQPKFCPRRKPFLPKTNNIEKQKMFDHSGYVSVYNTSYNEVNGLKNKIDLSEAKKLINFLKNK